MPPRAVPRATYRLQLTADFGFDAAAKAVPYLAKLGVSHLYLSPILKARTGSRHGYDIVDFGELNPELGDDEGFRRLREAVENAGMGILLDFVPNHMAVGGADNAWWLDVLRHGRASAYARFFDIDWDRSGDGRLVLPILGKPLPEVLAAGEIALRPDADGEFSAWYFEQRLPIDPATIDGLDLPGIGPEALSALLERQHYRLEHWRRVEEINYRRFFDVIGLAGLRVEDADVFAAVHGRLAMLIERGEIEGVRFDHIDGLRDPKEYFERVEALAARAPGGQLYRVVEKILGEGEEMPAFAGVAGTTGYEWLNLLTRLFVDPERLNELDTAWHARGGEDFDSILVRAKRYVIDRMLPGEFAALWRQLFDLADRRFPADQVRAALEAFVIAFPVYRTYVAGDGPSKADLRLIDKAFASVSSDETAGGALNFLRKALVLDVRPDSREAATDFVMRLQQFTGPLMAKALEDTAFYRHQRLIALNEVGGNPEAAPLGPSAFHQAMLQRQAAASLGLTATATHDTKRGEDARLRISAISEMAGEWDAAVRKWERMNGRLAEDLPHGRAPSRQHEYMLYQSLVGAWPLAGVDDGFRKRVEAFALKAAREGKAETSWLDPDPAYEEAVSRFVRRILDPAESRAFVASLAGFAERASALGAVHSLAALTLKGTMPGVPDFYQGTELWDLSFVDPDNRRPVDFGLREKWLAELADPPDWRALRESWRDGRLKLALTATLLAIRGNHADTLLAGDYRPVETLGQDSENVLAFERSGEGDRLLIAVGLRHSPLENPASLSWAWQGEIAIASAMEDVLSGRRHTGPVITLRELFDALPVAILRPLDG